MSFAIRSFDFRAMSAANSGASIDKLNEIIDSHSEVTMQVRELAREERTLDASIEETTNGLAQYEGNLSDDQLKEIRDYLDSANDRLCKVIEQREAAEEIRNARGNEIERMAEMLGITLGWESIGDGYPTYRPVSENALDGKKSIAQQKAEYRFNTNATLSGMVEEYNRVVTECLCTNKATLAHQRSLIYQAARKNDVKVVLDGDGTLIIIMF